MPQPIAELERARQQADRRYNDALSALDGAVVAACDRSALGRDDLARLGTALVVFLQQITAFVETKDREFTARVTQQIEDLAPAIASIGELRTQMTVLHRTTQLLSHTLAAGSPAAAAAAPPVSVAALPPAPAGADDVAYVGFEDEFRGSEESVQARLRSYVPLFSGCADVLDLGCGRGEFLRLLRDSGIAARGIDLNDEMVAAARAHGLDAVRADALGFLDSLPDESLGGLIATQVIEHLAPSYLMRLLHAARRTLRAGSPIVIETINPACWLAFFSSYIRDLTHVRPVHPDTLQYLLRATGFADVSLRYSAPVPDEVKMKFVELSSDLTASTQPGTQALVEAARVVNGNAAILNSLLFTYQDYAAVGRRI